jgi:hypothetical protein
MIPHELMSWKLISTALVYGENLRAVASIHFHFC